MMETSEFNHGHKGIAPEVDHVRSFFSKRHCPEEEADLFYYYYQSMDWSYENGLPVRDWKLAANEWLFNLED
ncbi:MAG TPA: hypothetical protein VK921_09275 [Anditalea sp.]|nr:hypothetical protein [Anditalea sp.]